MVVEQDSSPLPWVWVIEALACSSTISDSTLQGFINAAPLGRGDFSENIRELVALRTLEKLYSSANVVNIASSSSSSRVRFDFSRSCQDVLQEILGEIPMSKLKVDGTQLSKWDVFSFITHKRARIAKCHLQKLKESIMEGIQPLSDNLRERSGLFQRKCTASNVCESSRHNEALHDESNSPCNTTLMPQHAFGGEISQQQQIVSVPTNVALSNGIQHKISGAKPCSSNQTGLQPEDRNDSLQTVAVPTNDDNADEIQKEPNVASLNVSQKPVADDIIVVDAIDNPGGEPCSNNQTGLQPEDQNDSPQTVANPTNDDNVDEIQKEPIVTSLNVVSQKPVAGDKTVVNAIDNPGAEVELSSGSDGINNEEIDLAAKKSELLSPHGMLDQDVCVKCNEGGQLLVCKTTACSWMAHENCIGESTQLDGNGNFFCPSCAYSHKTSEYVEVEKNVSLAESELSAFISMSGGNEATKSVHRQEHSLSTQSSEHIQVKNNQNDRLIGCEKDREDHVGEHSKEANHVQLNRSQQEAHTSSVQLLCRGKENINDGSVAVLGREEERAEMPNVKSLTGGKKEVSKDKRDKPNISDFRYTKRVRKHETQCKPQASPEKRRKKTFWTKEEEDMIREGVQKFHTGDHNIPWRKILEFGSHVFSSQRQPQDLKDKWKKMCKPRKESK